MSREGEQVAITIVSQICFTTDISRVAKNLDPDLDIPMNAAPEEVEQKIPDTLSKYFTLDRDFNPVGVSSPTFTASPSLSLSAAGTFLRRGGRTRGERVGGEGLHHWQLRATTLTAAALHCKHRWK